MVNNRTGRRYENYQHYLRGKWKKKMNKLDPYEKNAEEIGLKMIIV